METFDFNRELIAHRSSLRLFAFKFANNEADAQDLLQDTMVKALTYRDKFQENTNFKAWLFTIMRNTFINNYRKAKRANTILDGTDTEYYLNVGSSDKTQHADHEVHLKQLVSFIDDLSDEYRIPFQMNYNGFKYQEIADKMNLPLGTVKSRIFLARKKLMEKIEDR